MREQGRVVTVRDGAVDVRMSVSASCAGCSACSHGAGGETIMHDVLDRLGATVGDTVEVSIPDSVRSKAALAVFLVPVGCLLVGYLAGFLLSDWLGVNRDVAGLVLGVAAAVIAFAGIRSADRRLAGNEQFRPKVDAIISRGHGHP